MKILLSLMVLSSIIQIYWFKKNTKRTRITKEAFNSVKDEKCICKTACNKYCNDKYYC